MNKDIQKIENGSWLDMSSNDLHVTIDCPLCDAGYMKKVEHGKELILPCCNISYKMEAGPGSTTNVYFNLTKQQAEKYVARR